MAYASKPTATHNPENALLRDFRAVDGGRGEYADWVRDFDEHPEFWAQQPGKGLLVGSTVGYTDDEIRHARTVLNRLAAHADVEVTA